MQHPCETRMGCGLKAGEAVNHNKSADRILYLFYRSLDPADRLFLADDLHDLGSSPWRHLLTGDGRPHRPHNEAVLVVVICSKCTESLVESIVAVILLVF